MSLSRQELLHSPEFVEPQPAEASLEEIRAKLTGHLSQCILLCEENSTMSHLEPAFRRFLKKTSNAQTLERIGNLAEAVTEFLDRNGLA